MVGGWPGTNLEHHTDFVCAPPHSRHPPWAPSRTEIFCLSGEGHLKQP